VFSPKVVVASFGTIERKEVINSTPSRELREKLSHARGTNSRLPFGVRLRAVSPFSWSIEQNTRDTQMTTRETGEARQKSARARER